VVQVRTFQSIASFSLASNFFFSSALTSAGTSASWLSFASASGVVSSLFAFVAVSVWLYHLVLADSVDRKGFNGAGENFDRTKGRWAIILEPEGMALEDEVKACRNMVVVV
jgi:hypothetical protein